jgi:hypothetical protein
MKNTVLSEFAKWSASATDGFFLQFLGSVGKRHDQVNNRLRSLVAGYLQDGLPELE